MKIQKWWGFHLRPQVFLRSILNRRAWYARSLNVPYSHSSKSNFYSRLFSCEAQNVEGGYVSSVVSQKGRGKVDRFDKSVLISKKKLLSILSNRKKITGIQVVGKSSVPFQGKKFDVGVMQWANKLVVQKDGQRFCPSVRAAAGILSINKPNHPQVFVPPRLNSERQKDAWTDSNSLQKTSLENTVEGKRSLWGEHDEVFWKKQSPVRDGTLRDTGRTIRGATQRLALRRRSGGVDEMSSPQYPGLSTGYL
nr:hypothetical protein [uncultured Neokomagataea sp.]